MLSCSFFEGTLCRLPCVRTIRVLLVCKALNDFDSCIYQLLLFFSLIGSILLTEEGSRVFVDILEFMC
jgi:hypothetical protein